MFIDLNDNLPQCFADHGYSSTVDWKKLHVSAWGLFFFHSYDVSIAMTRELFVFLCFWPFLAKGTVTVITIVAMFPNVATSTTIVANSITIVIKKYTIVATPTTIVAFLINHNCRKTNHECRKFFENILPT